MRILMRNNVYELRGHHLFNLFDYMEHIEVLSHSKEGRVFRKMLSSGGIMITNDLDAICACCEMSDRHKKEHCRFDLAAKNDEDFARSFGLSVGKVYPAEEIVKTVYEQLAPQE